MQGLSLVAHLFQVLLNVKAYIQYCLVCEIKNVRTDLSDRLLTCKGINGYYHKYNSSTDDFHVTNVCNNVLLLLKFGKLNVCKHF